MVAQPTDGDAMGEPAHQGDRLTDEVQPEIAVGERRKSTHRQPDCRGRRRARGLRAGAGGSMDRATMASIARQVAAGLIGPSMAGFSTGPLAR